MQTRLAEAIAYLDREHDALRSTVDAVPADRRDVRPTPESWSVADVVTHLVLVERRIAVLLETLIARAREQGIGPETSTESALASFDTAPLFDRSQRIDAPRAVDPRTDDVAYGWSDYAQAHAHLRAAASDGDGLALGEITHLNRSFGELDVYGWIAFVAAHAARHAAQIREIDAQLVAGTSAPGMTPAA